VKRASDRWGQEIVNAEATVRELYRHLLGRTPMGKELNSWSAYAREGVTVLGLVEHFISSEEYKSRFASRSGRTAGSPSASGSHRRAPGGNSRPAAPIPRTVWPAATARRR
jgi:hypothetical protein